MLFGKNILITKYIFNDEQNAQTKIEIGNYFESVSMFMTIEKIIKRFEEEFKNKNINSSLLKFLEDRSLNK